MTISDMDFLSSQNFWAIIFFIVLYIVLSRWLLPRISSGLKQRTHTIENEISEARNKREAVQEIKLDYAEELAAVDDETKQMFDASAQRITERRKQTMSELNAEMKREKDQFREDVAVASRQAVSDVRAQSEDLVADVSEQIIDQKTDASEAVTKKAAEKN